MIKKFLFLLILLVAFSSAQEKEPLAKFGGNEIDYENFANRFKLTIQTQSSIDEIERRNFLYSLTAEYLLALGAKEAGFDSSLIMQHTFKVVEKMLIRDKLYREEIAKKAIVTQEQLTYALYKDRSILEINFLFAEEYFEIAELFDLLLKGISFDSLLDSREEKQLQQTPIEIIFGKIDPVLEDILYSIDEGKFSSPIQDKKGWFIYYVRKITPRTIPQNETQKNIRRVQSILEEREKQNVYKKFYDEVLKTKKVETNGDLYWKFVDATVSLLNQKKIGGKIIKGKDIKIESSDLVYIESRFTEEELLFPFFIVENSEFSFRDFLYSFFFEGFYTDSIEENVISSKINLRVKSLIEQEIFAQIAYQKKYHLLPDVKTEIDNWKNYYLAQLYIKALRDSINVSDFEVQDYLNKMDEQKMERLKVFYFNSYNLDDIEFILNETERSGSLENAVNMITNELGNHFSYGISSLYSNELFSELGITLNDLELWSVYGPIQNDSGYTIIQVIDKKKELIKTENEKILTENVRKEIYLKKYSEKLIDNTVTLANKYSLKMNEQLAINADVKNLRMYVFRYIGFGGRMLAVPQTKPFIEWVEPWRKSEHQTP